MATSLQRYKNKVAIITGGSQGIGLGVAGTFVKHGAKVVIADIDENEGRKAENNLKREVADSCLFIKTDLRKEQEVKELIKATIERFGRLDCLVNNAGTHPTHHPIDDFSVADLEKLFSVNVGGYFMTCKYALPHIRKVEGNIINNASLVAQIGQPGAVTYVASKGAIMSMTKALAIDEARHHVRVNSFSPGNVLTPMWENLAEASGDYEKSMNVGKNAQLLGRFGTVEECGLVCLFLAADATFCTGININVSGGAELDYGHKNKCLD